MYHNLEDMMLLNGENMPNTFFVFSALLLSIMVYPTLKKKEVVSMKFFLKAVLHRYLRLASVMFIFLFFTSTWMHRFGSGFLWERVNYAERNFCRRNWWINVLFLNNYFSGDEKVD
jgi:hypothetical protein